MKLGRLAIFTAGLYLLVGTRSLYSGADNVRLEIFPRFHKRQSGRNCAGDDDKGNRRNELYGAGRVSIDG